MSSLWTDLLFLHGHISGSKLARQLVNTPTPPPAPPQQTGARQRSHSPRAIFSSWSARLCLGIGDGTVHTQ